MYCPVCKRDTTPIKIGADSYCSVCGTAYRKPAGPAAPAAPAASSPPTPAKTLNDVGAKPTAAALHQRATPARTIDLRPQAPQVKEAAAAPVLANPHGRTHLQASSAAAPNERHISQFTDRFERARKYSRSAQISRFGTDRMGNIQDPAKMYDKFGNPTLHTLQEHSSQLNAGADQAARPASHHVASPHRARLGQSELPKLAATQHEAMSKLPRYAPTSSPAPKPPPALRPRSSLTITPAASRTLAIAAAVVVMGGYIWFQNYPKLALQNANDRAGLAASLPSYLPSSYSLTGTSTEPGLVTLRFTSPSAAEALKISQHRTTWDSSSLLDNYIAKSADDYAAVQGQGLTIYFWGQNQASWVNHGIWYSIEGAARLSREQILKIAYSL